MRIDRSKNTSIMMTAFTIFTLIVLGASAPFTVQAEEPGNAPYVKANGNGIGE